MEFSNKKKFIYWWIFTLITITAIFWANYYGLLTKIWFIDITFATSIIALQYIISSSILGYSSFKYMVDENFRNSDIYKKLTDHCWFHSEILMAIGMAGTVIGIIEMASVFGNITNFNDPSVLQTTVINSFKATGIAFYTNIVGLITSIALKYQVQYVGYSEND